MKKTITAFFVLSFVLLAGFTIPESWVPYTTRAGHCSISFPGKPAESTEDQKTGDGKAFKINLATYSPTDNEVYMLGWINMTEFYPAGKSMEEILKNSRDGATASLGAKEVKTLKTDLGTEPYIEFTFSSDDFVGKDRIYVINKFQYSVITLFSKTKVIDPKADKFIQSFKHI